MKILLAQNSGFCMGVRNAVLKIVLEINSRKRDIHVYGPLIHNPQTIDVLSARGLITINDLKSAEGKEIAIRTHGITKEENRIIRRSASRILNLTCPRVARVQSIIKKHSSLGCFTIIIGDSDHAEVIGLQSYAENGFFIISDISDVSKIPQADTYILVSQTTYDRNHFKKIIESLDKSKNIKIFDTICDSTHHRQTDVITAIENGITTLVVVGGKNSANTARLAGIGQENGIKTFHIETESELMDQDFSSNDVVLVTAGASTPGWIINNVLEKLYNIGYQKSNFFLNTAKLTFEFLVRTNIISSAGGYFISLLNQNIMFGSSHQHPALATLLYIFSMYSINNYLDRDMLKRSNSYKYSIYSRYGKILLILSFAAFVGILFLFRDSIPLLIVTIAAYSIGSFYSTDTAKKILAFLNFSALRKIYNSKTITGAGWVLVTVIMPIMYFGEVTIGALPALFSVLAIIFIRQQLLDIIAFQSDLIMGKETFPIWFGVENVKKTVKWIAAAVIVSSLVYAAGVSETAPVIYAAAAGYYIYALIKISRQSYVISLKYELLVDFVFVLIFVLYCIYSLI